MKFKESDFGYHINWEKYEKGLKVTIPDSYKEMYEKLGAIGIDNYVYIANIVESPSIFGLQEIMEQSKECYNLLGGHLDEDAYTLKIGDKEDEWFPIGKTTNGDFIFVNDNQGVTILEGGFLGKEDYECSLIEFINKYLNDDMKYEVLSEGLDGEEHELTILAKE